MNSVRSFTCYFCNKLIEKETESSHISTCGSVLEPCPNKCGSYVQRSMKVKHMQECSNKRTDTLPRLIKQKRIEQTDMLSSPPSSTGSNAYNNIPIAQNTNPYRDNINMITNRCFAIEETLSRLHKAVDGIRSRQEQVVAKTATFDNMKFQNDKLFYQNQMLLEWKKNAEAQLNNLNYEASQNLQSRIEIERKCMALVDEKMKLLQEFNASLNNQKDNFLREQLYNRETQNELQSQIKKFESFYSQENAAVCALWTDQGKQIEGVKENVAALTSSIEDQKLKHSSVVFDLRAISQVSSENAEKLEMQERELKEIKKSLLQLKIDVEMLDEANHSREHNLPGYLVWKISEFSLKMETAKSNNFILRSPPFHSHHFGYKIRLLVYLNGIKKWKGRHMIACLHVLKGDYDLMLPWPCHLEGNVTIKDLQDHTNPKHITKFITAKRDAANEDTEEPQESSSQYIFVSHSQLLKSCHIKEDTLFIEIKLNKSRKYQDETSL